MADFRALLDRRSVNATAAWLATGVLVLVTLPLLANELLWPAFTLLVVGVVVLPPILTRDARTTMPGELVAAVALPVVLHAAGLFQQATPFVTMAGLALMVLLVLDAFTSLEMAPRFAVLFVVVTTMAFAGAWAIAQFAADVFFGTGFIDGQRELNLELLTATIVGILAGVAFGAYFVETDGDAPLGSRSLAFGSRTPAWIGHAGQRDYGGDRDPSVVDETRSDDETSSDDEANADDGVPESPAIRLTIRGLQLLLVGIVAYSVVTVQGSLFVNSGVPLALSLLPAIARRRYGYPMHAGLALLIALAATLHAIGSLGPYQQTDWYDTVTHALSSTLVAGVGYAIAHSIELHTDRVSFSPRFRGTFVVMFVLAVGVLWELMEFASGVAAGLFGAEVLAQYGTSDIVKDLTFNAVGAVIVALWGTQLFRRPARKLTGSVGELFR